MLDIWVVRPEYVLDLHLLTEEGIHDILCNERNRLKIIYIVWPNVKYRYIMCRKIWKATYQSVNNSYFWMVKLKVIFLNPNFYTIIINCLCKKNNTLLKGAVTGKLLEILFVPPCLL